MSSSDRGDAGGPTRRSGEAGGPIRRAGDAGAQSTARRSGLRVVLVEPSRGANVGAACRAISNMGAGELFIVGGQYDAEEARRTAVHAGDVFDSRRHVDSIAEAVAPCALVVGTTSRSRPWSIPVVSVGEVFADARRRGLGAAQVAIVFGPEDHGLTNEQLARCHRVAFIPTASEYSSLNLAQAVVVCLYEWLRGQHQGAATGQAGAAPPASAAEQDVAIADLEGALGEIGFLDGDQGERVMASVASILVRSGLDERESRIVRGIARQIRWAARRGATQKL